MKDENEALRARIAQLVQDSTTSQRTIERLQRQKATAESNVAKLEGDIEFIVEEFRNQMSEEEVLPSTMTNEPQLVNIFTRDLAKWGANTRRLRLDLAQAEQELDEFMSETWVVEMRVRNEALQTEADQLRESNSAMSSNLRYLRGEFNREKQAKEELDEQLSAEIARRQDAEDEGRRYKRYLRQEQDRVADLEIIVDVITNGGCLAEGSVSELKRNGILKNVKTRFIRGDIFQVYFSADYVNTCKSD